MTDRLTTLLHDEVDGLELPPPPAARIIADGRAMRRRRTTGLVAGAVAIVLVAGAATLSALQSPDRDSVEPADRTAYLENGAWARGDEVHVGSHVVDVPGASTLAYTSLGAVVGTDRGHFVLVTVAGRVERLRLDIAGDVFDRPVATDPAAPYLAYVRAVDDTTDQLAVRDLSTGEETTVGEPFPASTSGPSEAGQLWGDVVFWLQRGNTRFTDWSTGARIPDPSGPWSTHSFAAGTYVGFDHETKSWVVVSRSDGSTLLSTRAPTPTMYSTASLSLDGRYLAVAGQTAEFTVYDVATHRKVVFPDRVLSGYSWTPDGHLVGKAFPLQTAEVETCDPASGACVGTGVDVSGKITLVPAPTSPLTS